MKCSRECVKPASNKAEEDWAEGRLEARAAVVVAYFSAVDLEAGQGAAVVAVELVIFGGGRGRFDINRPHGSIYYTVGDSALNAAPYSLTGRPSIKPGYLQNRVGVSLGGPLNIPKIYKGGNKTFFFVNYNGYRGENPFDQFSTVPTLLERAGDFSQSTIRTQNSSTPVQLFDPFTHQPIPNNNVANDPTLKISPIAQGLLKFIPLPNLPGDVQNFHFSTAAISNSDDLNIRLMRAFGGTSIGPRRRGPQNNLTFGLHYHSVRTDLTNAFPSVGGNYFGAQLRHPYRVHSQHW